MRVQREGTKIRHRSFTVANGQRARVWLEMGAGLVVLHTVGVNTSGQIRWRRCSTAGCLGAGVGSSGSCLAHAREDERAAHLTEVLSGSKVLELEGVEITEQLWNEILEVLSSKSDSRHVKPYISCAGAVFGFKLRLSDWTFEGPVALTGAILEDGCEISGCNFSGLGLNDVDVRNSQAVFRDCSVDRELSLSYAHCDQQYIGFAECKMRDNVRAEGFAGGLRFSKCKLEKACLLPKSSFTILSFSESEVSGELNLEGLEAEWIRAPGFRFATTSTLGPFTVKYCDISGAQFNTRVQLMVNAKGLDLRGASFQQGGRLEVERALVDLERLILGAPLTVVGSASAAVKSIRNADAGSLSFAHIDLSRCVFYGAHGLQNVTLEPTVKLPSSPKHFRTRRRCIADEYAWRGRHTKFRRNDWVIPGTQLTHNGSGESTDPILPELTPAEVSQVYRSLRKSLESLSNEPGAADFYYGEMEMRRNDLSLIWHERLVIYAYWLTSGYGLRALRALGCLVILTLIGGLILLRWGFVLSGHRPVDGLIAAAQSVVPGVAVSEQLTNWGKTFDLGLTVLGPVFIALVVLALRNRVKR